MGIEGYYEDYFDERNYKPETNYDRIRNMSVDEMAELLYLLLTDCLNTSCDKCFFNENKILVCQLSHRRISIKQWLLAESEVEE